MKYVIVAYLRCVKGYRYPYDFYLCNNHEVMMFNLERCKHLILIGRYSHYEVFKEYEFEVK